VKYKTESEFLKNYDANKYEHPSVATDVVIFSVSTDNGANWRRANKKKFSILLAKREDFPSIGKWNLPGGFVSITETAETAARRTLNTKTGLTDNIYLEQLYTFDDLKRDPRTRIISIAYMTLIDKSKLHITETEHSKWFTIHKNHLESDDGLKLNFSDLAFDHNEILHCALNRLKNKIEYTDIVFNMMPHEFTLGELQQVFEAILERDLLTADFRRRIKDKVIQTGKMQSGFGHRPAALFKYKK
jgi:ADP-ribose pyrophosphatase YjhB (NUDIX family)